MNHLLDSEDLNDSGASDPLSLEKKDPLVVNDDLELVITVPSLLAGVRIDKAISLLSGISRLAAKTLIEDGKASVSGVVVRNRSFVLRPGTRLEVSLPDHHRPVLAPDDEIDFEVVYEDSQIVVVNKPAGLVVHPGAGNLAGTLANGLVSRYPDLVDLSREGICDWDRPGIVHRLDRGTSGLLVVARTSKAYRSLVSQLSERTMQRKYLSLVDGYVNDDKGLIDAPIGRSERTPTRMAVSRRGSEARTSYRVIKRYCTPRPLTLLELSLETGRTHQIRVHMAAIGHPVLGDTRYGLANRMDFACLLLSQLKTPETRAVVSKDRLFLHAFELGLQHPYSSQRMVFSSVLPQDLDTVIQSCQVTTTQAQGL